MADKIIGLIPAFACENFIEPAIKQALDICDEVIVSVGPYAENLKKYEDSTRDICERYANQICIVDSILTGTHSSGQRQNLNHMLEYSNMFEPGNWVFLLCVDEFYYEDDLALLKDSIFNSDYDGVENKETQYFINTKKCLYSISTAHTLWKIKDRSERFTHTANWNGNKQQQIFNWGSVSRGKQHYGLLMDPYFKKALWATYGSIKENRSFYGIKWMDEIYLKYDLSDEHTYINKNKAMFGFNSPLRHVGIVNDDGTLLDYRDRHPKVIEEAGLTKIEDFRTLYNEK